MSKPEVIRTVERLSEIEARNLHRGTEYLSPLVVASLCATIRELWAAEALTKELEKAKAAMWTL